MTLPKRRRLNVVPSIALLTTQLDKTSDTTLANLEGMVHYVTPGTYEFFVSLQVTAGASGGTKVAFKYTDATLSALQSISEAKTASAVAVSRVTSTTDQASLTAATAAHALVEIKGTMVVSASGTIQVQGAQNASNGTATNFFVGSYFELQRVS